MKSWLRKREYPEVPINSEMSKVKFSHAASEVELFVIFGAFGSLYVTGSSVLVVVRVLDLLLHFIITTTIVIIIIITITIIIIVSIIIITIIIDIIFITFIIIGIFEQEQFTALMRYDERLFLFPSIFSCILT